jgi:hypothetical protein
LAVQKSPALKRERRTPNPLKRETANLKLPLLRLGEATLSEAAQMHSETAPAPAPQLPAKRWRDRIGFRAMIYLIAAYVAWLVLLFFWQDRMMFPRHVTAPPRPIPYSKETAAITLEIAGGGQVQSWFIPAPGATAQNPRPVVVFFHGNAEIIDWLDDVIEGYRGLGCSVFLPEYRGYGRSDGRPSEKAICADAVCFYDELIKRPDVDKSRIVFYGRSLGGGVAAAVAALRKPAALILQSTFKNVAGMACRFGAPPFLVRNPFRTDRAIAKLDVPVLIFHGARDEIIPVTHGRRLRDLASRAVYIEYDCGHNDFPGPGNENAYWFAIKKFLSRNGIVTE